jgi:dipeptidase
VWGVYRQLASSLDLSPEYEEWRKSRPYPVSAKPDAKVAVADIAAAMRSYYEGTPYDGTAGLAAGAWGAPDHVVGGSATGKVKGNWERTIGLFRTSDSYIVQSRGWLPGAAGGLLWFGAHAAPYTLYVPFAIGMASLPPSTLGHPAKLDKGTLFWATRYLANYVQLKRSAMVKEVNALQARMFASSLKVVASADASADRSPAALNKTYSDHSADVLRAMWSLADELMFKYADGFINEVQPDSSLKVTVEPYADWWLKAVGYEEGPPPVPEPSRLVMV